MRRLSMLLVLVGGCVGTSESVEVVHEPLPDGEVVTYVVNNGEQAKIIGPNDLKAVLQDGTQVAGGGALNRKYTSLVDAFGRLSMGCTATHIGDGLVLTAGHCFNAPSGGMKDQPCSGTTVKWGVRQDKAAYLTSTCTRIVDAKLTGNIDYAIFRVSPVPPVKVEVDVDARPPTGRPLTIFGHPQGRPLEWSGVCTLQPASVAGLGTAQFAHQCDTEPGSSGSTVLDDTTLRVIGIHDGGSPTWNYASYLFDSPLKSYLGTTTPPPPPPTDTKAPTLALVSPAGGSSLAGSTQLAIAVDASDETALDDVVMQWNQTSRTISCKAPPSQWKCTSSGTRHTFTAQVGTGSRTFSLTAVDRAGNKTQAGPFTINLQ